MPVQKELAHQALQLINEYRGQLITDTSQNSLSQEIVPLFAHNHKARLAAAIDKVVGTFQMRLYNALYEVQDFYEYTLLDQNKTIEDKINQAEALADRWQEAISNYYINHKSLIPEEELNRLSIDESPKYIEDAHSKPIPKQRTSRSMTAIFDQDSGVLSAPKDESKNYSEIRLKNEITTTEVIISKGKSGFGFSIAGGIAIDKDNFSQIYVSRLSPGGSAEHDGELQVNDAILSVNGVSLVNVSHEDAVKVIKKAGAKLNLIIERNIKSSQNQSTNDPSIFSPSIEFSNPYVSRDHNLQRSGEFSDNELSIESYCDEKVNEVIRRRHNSANIKKDLDRRLIDKRFQSVELISEPNHRTVDTSEPVCLIKVNLTRPKDDDELGFSIAGGTDSQCHFGDSGIFITKIVPGSLVHKDGRISVGDRLIQVNKTSLIDVTHEEAVRALQICETSLQLVIIKNNKPNTNIMASYPDIAASQDVMETSKRWSEIPATTASTTSTSAGRIDISSAGVNERPQSQYILPNIKVHSHRERRRHRRKSSTSGLQDNDPTGLIKYTLANTLGDYTIRFKNARLVTLFKFTEMTAPQLHGKKISGQGSLGIHIVGVDGHDGVFISQIQPDKPAGISRQVFVGDRVLAVNGYDVMKSNHEGAASILKNAHDRVDLVLAHCLKDYEEFERRYGNLTVRNEPNRLSGVPGVSLSSSQHSIPGGCISSSSYSLGRSRTGAFHVRAQVNYHPDEDPILQNDLHCQSTINKSKYEVASFRSGEIFKIKSELDDDWWLGRRILPQTGQSQGHTLVIPNRKHMNRILQFINMPKSPESRQQLQMLSEQQQQSGDEEISGDYQKSNSRVQSSATPSSNLKMSLSKLEQVISHRTSSQESLRSPRSRLHGADSNLSAKMSTTLLAARRNLLMDIWAPTSCENSSTSDQSALKNFCLSYVDMIPITISYTRPVVIIGSIKEFISDDLLYEFPDKFSSCVPYTTRLKRKDEVEGRDYHFVVSRSVMEEEIRQHMFIEAGEYNNNLYGTHVKSVFEVADSGRHCLLDVGGPALRRLDAAGLNPIAILVNSIPEAIGNKTEGEFTNNDEISAREKMDLGLRRSSKKNQDKIAKIVREYSSCLTAIVSESSYETAYRRVKQLIFDNAGPRIWVEATSIF